MLTNAELSEIRERLEKATPGPWVIAVHDYSMADIHSTTKKYGDMSPVLSVSPCEGCQDRAKEGAEKEGRKPKWEWGRCTVGVEADWRFIAHAPTDISALLAEVDRLRGALQIMNAVSDHQTNRVFPPTQLGDMAIPCRVHPLTCGNDSSHEILFPYWNGVHVVLRCPDCDYEQDNSAIPGRREAALQRLTDLAQEIDAEQDKADE